MTNTYRFADISVQITSIHPVVHSLCVGYESNEPAAFSVLTDQNDIDKERFHADFSEYSDAYLETLAVYRKIAEKLPGYDAFLFHGSAIAVDGAAYVFAAKSGTGKSTHTRLWREMLGNQAVMVNDDKPLIRVQSDNTALVYGTPWDGKHHLSNNISVPVRAICILERSQENQIHEISKSKAFPMLLQQTYRPADADALAKTLVLLDRLDVRFYRLGCNMDISAAELIYQTMKEAHS